MTTILCLPWKDILQDQILMYFDIKMLFRLRCVSVQFKVLTDEYISSRIKTLDLHLFTNFSTLAYKVSIRLVSGENAAYFMFLLSKKCMIFIFNNCYR